MLRGVVAPCYQHHQPKKVARTFCSESKLLQNIPNMWVCKFYWNIIGLHYAAILIIIVDASAGTNNNKTSKGLCRGLMAFYWSNYK